MKKISLLLASTMLATVSAFAQTKPAAPAYTSFDAAFANQDNAYYLYNVEAGLFLCGGNDWGTRASLAAKGSTIVSYEDLTLGKAEVAGIPWTLGEGSLTNGTECYSLENKDKGGVYNTVDNLDGIWVDGGSDRPYNKWFVNKLDGNTFQLSFFVLGTDEEGNATEDYVKPAGWYGAQRLASGDTRTYIEEGANTTWAFVSKAEYEKVQPKLNLYYVQVGLADLIAKAKAQGSTADFSAYEALVNDANADRAEVIKVIEVISPAILLGEAIKEAKATDPSRDYSKFEALFNGTEATAAELNEATALLKSIISLKKAIDAAEAEYPSLDFSEPKAVYNNLDTTAEDIAAAKDKVQSIIDEYLAGQATVDNPKDYSHYITNATFDKVNDFTGWSGTAFGAGGTTSTCAEHFAKTFDTYQDLNGGKDIPNGVYRVGVNAFYRAGSTANDWATKDDPTVRHAQLYAASDALTITTGLPSLSSWATDQVTIGVTTGDAGELYVPNSMKDFTDYEDAGLAKEVNVYAVVTNNKLRIGVKKSTTLTDDWTIVDNFTLFYLGQGSDAYDLVSDDVLAEAERKLSAIDWETAIYTTSLKEAYEAAKTKLQTAADASSIESVVVLSDSLVGNVAAWKAYDDAVFAAQQHSILNGEKSGPYIELLEEYVGNDAIEPNEDYKRGSYKYIINALTLSTAEVEAETAFLAQLLDDAIKKSMASGDDVSDMLVNPKFNDGFEGWTTINNDPSKIYKSTNGASNCVEVYEAVVDLYQTVTDVPDGIYSLTAQAFERPGANGSFEGTEEPKVFLYMNDFQTPVMLITEDGQDPATAVTGVSGQVTAGANCFLNASGAADGAWPYDYDFNGTYIPNSLEGASYAFQGGRYTQKVYGLVEGGTMKIGLTSNGVKLGGSGWVLWSNFTLTYEGKTVEALNELLDTYIAKAETYTENPDNMTTPVSDALDNAISDALEAQDSDDADEMWEALIALNKAVAEAQENIAAVEKLQTALEAMEDAFNSADNPSKAAQDAYDEIQETDYYEMTTEEVKNFIEKVKDVTARLNANEVPEGWENASDENPFDMTGVIVNPDFEIGTTEGWTYAFEAITNIGYQANKDYSNGDVTISKFIEGWRSNNDPIGDGTIEQTLFELPAGTYVLAADIVATWQKTGKAEDTEGMFLFASEIGGNKSAIEVATGNEKPEHFEVTFTKESDESALTIGIEALKSTGNWLAADNFTLTYYGKNSALEADGDATPIEGVVSDASEISAIYTVAGAKVSSLQKGINIVKYTNGKVVKVLVK